MRRSPPLAPRAATKFGVRRYIYTFKHKSADPPPQIKDFRDYATLS